jgi:beta-galactosidase
MEDLDQSYGYILYRKILTSPRAGDLILDEVHDYARVFVNGKAVGTVDRRLGATPIQLEISKVPATLDILVENSGRVNYGDSMGGERKGITNKVTFAGTELLDWDIYPLPMREVSALPYAKTDCEGACFYEATFNIKKSHKKSNDTFLDTHELGKGMVFVNGRPLGRFWTSLGPQGTLYLPGPWLRNGKNTIQVFDLDGHSGWKLKGLDRAILDQSPRNDSR